MLNLVILILFYGMYTFCFVFPRGFLLRLSKILSFILSFIPISPIDRNLKVIFSFRKSKNLEDLNARAIKSQYIYYFFKNIVDFYKFLVIKPDGFHEVLEIDPKFDDFLKIYNENQGLISVAMHLGNWELGPLIGFKYGVQMNSLVFQQLSPVLEHLISTLRRRYGVGLLHQRKGVKEGIKKLNEGQFLSFLGDQDGTKNGFLQEFCGMTCSFPRGIELFVKKTNARVVPVVLIHVGDSYRLIIEDEIDVTTNRATQNFESLHIRLKELYEKYILLYPEQWLLVYDRFKFRHDKHLKSLGIYDQVKQEHKDMFSK
ncbi:MAG: lysophospholipid acyltransferase family protein [Candidatus Cloacimonetes bacterium]|nr:lysophospholipid acyltransferase family protein [Candidatus Cloacimonadota bacterium]